MTFQTNGLGRPQDVTLSPFYKIFQQRYTVYWKIYSPTEWDKKRTEVAATEAHRTEIERRTVDAVSPGDEKSEHDHAFLGEGVQTGDFYGRPWRASKNGWFSYVLKVDPSKPVTLVCTYRGSEGRTRVFDVVVDGRRIATESLQNHPAEFFDSEYVLPADLTHGKQRITVKFQSHPEVITGSVFDVRAVQ